MRCSAWSRSISRSSAGGRGYPDGLAAEEISLESRILAVADAYEAMTADRAYRSGVAAADARGELERCSGSQFDPVVVDAFLSTIGDALGDRVHAGIELQSGDVLPARVAALGSAV